MVSGCGGYSAWIRPVGPVQAALSQALSVSVVSQSYSDQRYTFALPPTTRRTPTDPGGAGSFPRPQGDAAHSQCSGGRYRQQGYINVESIRHYAEMCWVKRVIQLYLEAVL